MPKSQRSGNALSTMKYRGDKEAAEMGRASRDKGPRRERQVVALHQGMGIKAERVPLSGAVRYQGNGPTFKASRFLAKLANN